MKTPVVLEVGRLSMSRWRVPARHPAIRQSNASTAPRSGMNGASESEGGIVVFSLRSEEAVGEIGIIQRVRPLTPALSPSDGVREKNPEADERSQDGDSRVGRHFSLSLPERERAGVRVRSICILAAFNPPPDVGGSRGQRSAMRMLRNLTTAFVS